MTLDEAKDVLSRPDDEPLVLRLRAHAVMWSNGRTPEHADYCHEAANRIVELEASLRDVVSTWAAGGDGKDMAKAMLAANKVLRRGSQPKGH